MPTISPFNIWVPDESTALKPLATSFVTMATSISNALQATDAGAARPFASAAARDAYFPFPVQGNRAFAQTWGGKRRTTCRTTQRLILEEKALQGGSQ